MTGRVNRGIVRAVSHLSAHPFMSIEAIAIIVLGLALGALVKGVSGIGLPLVAIPVMAPFIGVETSVVIMVIPSFFVQSWLTWDNRHEAASLPALRLMVVTAIIGVAAGCWVLSAADERWIVGGMAAWVGAYLLTVALRIDPWARLREAKRGGPFFVMLAGVAQGATGISGPLIASYMHALKLNKSAYILCCNVIFQIFMVAQFVTFLALGMMTWERVQMGLLACIPVAIMLPVAIAISRRISQRIFNMFVVALLVVMEIRLIARILG
jgi:uncharacterized membrane protein YfcA